MTGIYVAHTPAQAEQANSLVELLEASLALDDAGIRCSTLPGYAAPTNDAASLRAGIGGSQAVIALVDDHALRDPQMMLELGVAFTYEKRMMLLVEAAERGEHLPDALRGLSLVERVDESALIAMVEDLAFELGLRPRLGDGAQEALRMLSSAPPPPDQIPTVRPAKSALAAVAVTNVPKPAPLPSFEEGELAASSEPTAAPDAATFDDPALFDDPPSYGEAPEQIFESEAPPPRLHAVESGPEFTQDHAPAYDASAPPEPLRSEPPVAMFHGLAPDSSIDEGLVDERVIEQSLVDEELELLDDDLVMFDEESVQPASMLAGITCQASLEAGRAVSECSYHRDEGGDFARELEGTFGRFVDGLGGNWSSLRNLDDVEVWLGATDNLLEALPLEHRYAADWYELGFQFSTMRSIAEAGLPEAQGERAAYEEIWHQSAEQFWRSAEQANLAPEDVVQIRTLLENLLGPESQRDYTNLSRSLDILRAHAEAADKHRKWFG